MFYLCIQKTLQCLVLTCLCVCIILRDLAVLDSKSPSLGTTVSIYFSTKLVKKQFLPLARIWESRCNYILGIEDINLASKILHALLKTCCSWVFFCLILAVSQKIILKQIFRFDLSFLNTFYSHKSPDKNVITCYFL